MATIESIAFGGPIEPWSRSIEVQLEGGGRSRFAMVTPREPVEWMKANKADYCFGAPALFVARVDEGIVGEAVEAMARDMGGYWLRYYHSPDKPAPMQTLHAAKVQLAEMDPPRKPAHSSAVAEVMLEDRRLFSILAATPSWFEEIAEKAGLRFYFGPSILFARRMDLKIIKAAVEAMARDGDRWLCRHDTPRTTLRSVLESFKAAHD